MIPSSRIPLEILRVETPCPADWSAMEGDDTKRFCSGCRKHVHNLSAMPREQAEQLVCESAGNLCIRMQRTADGTVVTIDYQKNPSRLVRKGWKFWTGVGLVGALASGLVQALTGRGTSGPVFVAGAMCPIVTTQPTTQPVEMGGICPPIVATQPSTQPATAPVANPAIDRSVRASDPQPTLGRLTPR